MKYLKLFEQFEDEEDAWWEELDEKDKLYIIKYENSYTEKEYFIGSLDENIITLFDNCPYKIKVDENWKIVSKDIIINSEDSITIYDKYHKHSSNIYRNYAWKKYHFNNLPKEIKNRII